MSLFVGEHQERARDHENAAPGVTLWQVLDVEERLIPPECRGAALRLPWWWTEQGRPAGKVALSVFLHHSLNRCAREGIRYPKIVLKRLKQAQRGEWQPADHSREAIMRRGGFMSAAEIIRGGRDEWVPRTVAEAEDD